MAPPRVEPRGTWLVPGPTGELNDQQWQNQDL